jgi:hypothetical protein
MNKAQFRALLIGAFIVVLLFGMFFWLYQKNHHPHQAQQSQQQKTGQHEHRDKPHQDHHKKDQSKHSKKKQEPLWGVDTAGNADDSLYKCVSDHYGKPDFWGRYMKSKGDTSVGLTKDEISFIHKKDGKILLIYKHFSDATGYDKGMSEANDAISFAKDLGVPKGRILFADVEPTYPVDSGFIRGWVKKLSSSQYKAGIYGDFSRDSKLREAYQAAMKKVDQKPILWSFQPRPGITTKKKAPDLHPAAPKSSRASVWQYGINAKQCNIDTDLAQSKIEKYLW